MTSSVTIDLPGEADLAPLYEAAHALGEADTACWHRWVAVKRAVFERDGHQDHGLASREAYADPEYEKLDAARKAAGAVCQELKAGIEARFPGVQLPMAGHYVARDGTTVDRYKAAVRSALCYYFQDRWRDRHADDLASFRARVSDARGVRNVKPGMAVITRKGVVLQIDKATHGGKRIVASSIPRGDAVILRPGDVPELRRISRDLLDGILAHHRAFEEALARHGLGGRS